MLNLQFISEENNRKCCQHSNNSLSKHLNKQHSHQIKPQANHQKVNNTNINTNIHNIDSLLITGKSRNVWKPNSNEPLPKTTPMSVVASTSNTKNSQLPHHSNDYRHKNKQRPNTLAE